LDLGIEGKVAVVTGAGRGVGRAVAERLCSEGARTVLVARDAPRLERAASELRSAGGEAHAIAADVGDPAAVAALHARVEAELGPAAILVHAASAPPRYAPFASQSGTEVADAARDALALVELATRAFLPGMVARRWGRIVFVGSLAGALGGRGQAAYATAKAALVGLVRTLAREHGGDGVTANLVVLGAFDTERLSEALDDEARASLARRAALGRLGEPREAADAILFLASERASFITGAELPVTGG